MLQFSLASGCWMWLPFQNGWLAALWRRHSAGRAPDAASPGTRSSVSRRVPRCPLESEHDGSGHDFPAFLPLGEDHPAGKGVRGAGRESLAAVLSISYCGDCLWALLLERRLSVLPSVLRLGAGDTGPHGTFLQAHGPTGHESARVEHRASILSARFEGARHVYDLELPSRTAWFWRARACPGPPRSKARRRVERGSGAVRMPRSFCEARIARLARIPNARSEMHNRHQSPLSHSRKFLYTRFSDERARNLTPRCSDP